MYAVKSYVSAGFKVAELHIVNSVKILKSLLAAILALYIFFDVSVPFDIAPATDATVPDPGVEAQYDKCYTEADRAMHEVAFATIDNPDVQKEYISTNRERIARDCRRRFPEQLITVQQPSRFNIFDVKPRFW